MINLAVIGDIHSFFSEFDVHYFNTSTYDLILITGDLPFHGREVDWQVVQRLAMLNKPSLLIAGNHDCVNQAQFLAEAANKSHLADLLNPHQQKMAEALRRALKPVVLCGYSAHDFRFPDMSLSIVATRPFSFGGPHLHYQRLLASKFAVDSLQASRDRLIELVNETTSETLIFLGHNGPSGLGAGKEDIWGCDFRPSAGDYGDPDYEAAVNHAKKIGKRVLLVVGGHMHHTLRDGRQRRWLVNKDGTTYLNPARVPRIWYGDTQIYHHHIQIVIDGESVLVHEKIISRDLAE